MPRKAIYDSEFPVRLRMALHHAGMRDWRSPLKVGEFFGKSKQTAHQWMRGSLPEPRALFEVESRLKDCSAKWLITGKDEPEWVKYLNPDSYRDDAGPASPSGTIFKTKPLPSTRKAKKR